LVGSKMPPGRAGRKSLQKLKMGRKTVAVVKRVKGKKGKGNVQKKGGSFEGAGRALLEGIGWEPTGRRGSV